MVERILATALLFFSCAGLIAQTDGVDDSYKKIAKYTVAVRAENALGEESGSGIILAKDGYVMTTYLVVKEDSKNIRVWTDEPRRFTARIVRCFKELEVSVIKIESSREFPVAELADSTGVKIGDSIISAGNSYNSIINDAQVTQNLGGVSGFYKLTESFYAPSTYRGFVFEVTAAVNPADIGEGAGMAGGPLADSKGKVVGVLILNYSPFRFLGNAIPVNYVKKIVMDAIKSAQEEKPVDTNQGKPYIGFSVKENGSVVVVASIDPSGPAALSGLSVNDIVRKVRKHEIKSMKDFERAIEDIEAGSVLVITIQNESGSEEIKIEVVGKNP